MSNSSSMLSLNIQLVLFWTCVYWCFSTSCSIKSLKDFKFSLHVLHWYALLLMAWFLSICFWNILSSIHLKLHWSQIKTFVLCVLLLTVSILMPSSFSSLILESSILQYFQSLSKQWLDKSHMLTEQSKRSYFKTNIFFFHKINWQSNLLTNIHSDITE